MLHRLAACLVQGISNEKLHAQNDFHPKYY